MLNVVLIIHADGDTGENARPCLDRIQALSGLTRPTIVKHLRSKKGWIEKTQTGVGRSPNIYALRIPQQTIDEIIALYSESSGKPDLPLEGQDASHSGKAALPLDASSKEDLPLEPPVVVNGFNHYEIGKGRSGENEARSGKATLPYLLDTKQNRESTRRKRVKARLPDDFVLPDSWREYPRRTHGWTEWQIDFVFREWKRYWTGDDAKNGGLKSDWKGTWEQRCDDHVGKVPPDPTTGAGNSGYGPNGSNRGVRL